MCFKYNNSFHDCMDNAIKSLQEYALGIPPEYQGSGRLSRIVEEISLTGRSPVQLYSIRARYDTEILGKGASRSRYVLLDSEQASIDGYLTHVDEKRIDIILGTASYKGSGQGWIEHSYPFLTPHDAVYLVRTLEGEVLFENPEIGPDFSVDSFEEVVVMRKRLFGDNDSGLASIERFANEYYPEFFHELAHLRQIAIGTVWVEYVEAGIKHEGWFWACPMEIDSKNGPSVEFYPQDESHKGDILGAFTVPFIGDKVAIQRIGKHDGWIYQNQMIPDDYNESSFEEILRLHELRFGNQLELAKNWIHR